MLDLPSIFEDVVEKRHALLDLAGTARGEEVAHDGGHVLGGRAAAEVEVTLPIALFVVDYLPELSELLLGQVDGEQLSKEKSQ